MKKKKQKFRVTKKDLSRHRKILRSDDERVQGRSGIVFDKERYLLAMVTLKRKLTQIASDIAFVMANSEDAQEHLQDLQHAREYAMFAKDRLGDTELFFTDSYKAPKKKLKRRPVEKKRKLNRRKT